MAGVSVVLLPAFRFISLRSIVLGEGERVLQRQGSGCSFGGCGRISHAGGTLKDK